ncbi:MAG: aminopeptidase [Thermoplasmata archaeon]|nr:aminopeptidase [Thermoplasmata archaeon]
MSDPSPELATKVAQNVLSNTLRIRKGENVVIEAWSESLPWAKPFVVEARRMGANPLMLYEDEESFWDALKTGQSRHTGRVGAHEWAALGKTAAYVFFFGPSEWPRFDDIPPKQQAGVAAYNQEWYRRAAKAKIRGARLYLGRTSQLAADRWKLDLDAWRDEMARASLVPPADLHRMGTRVANRLRKGKLVKVSHSNGTEVSFRLGKFPILLDDAVVDAADLKAGNNMATIPGGVVGLSIDHQSADGTIVGNHTTYPDAGPVTGTRWTFVDGHLTEQSYESGGGPTEAAYAKAPRAGRDRLSFFSVGLNPEITKIPQMEDQELGAALFHIGGNTFRGGENASPFGTWTVVKGADVSIDGKSLIEDGRIV